MQSHQHALKPSNNKGIVFSTEDFPIFDRQEWLHEIIGREYANVKITPPKNGRLFNEMTIHPWQQLKLSSIRSNAISIERLPKEIHSISQDSYFLVVLLSGRYMLEQNGREVFLNPGEMTIYDATHPHRIYCPESFSKLIVSIPRPLLRDRLAGIEHCTARQISTRTGMNAITANLLRSTAKQIDHLDEHELDNLSNYALDMLTMTLASVRPQNFNLSRSRSLSMNRIKDFIERHLTDGLMDTVMISTAVKLSPRYINSLFQDENTSLMRYVWQRRLEKCRKDILDDAHKGHRISDIAVHWGFNDLAHFSRAFKLQFDYSPREYRQEHNL